MIFLGLQAEKEDCPACSDKVLCDRQQSEGLPARAWLWRRSECPRARAAWRPAAPAAFRPEHHSKPRSLRMPSPPAPATELNDRQRAAAGQLVHVCAGVPAFKQQGGWLVNKRKRLLSAHPKGSAHSARSDCAPSGARALQDCQRIHEASCWESHAESAASFVRAWSVGRPIMRHMRSASRWWRLCTSRAASAGTVSRSSCAIVSGMPTCNEMCALFRHLLHS